MQSHWKRLAPLFMLQEKRGAWLCWNRVICQLAALELIFRRFPNRGFLKTKHPLLRYHIEKKVDVLFIPLPFVRNDEDHKIWLSISIDSWDICVTFTITPHFKYWPFNTNQCTLIVAVRPVRALHTYFMVSPYARSRSLNKLVNTSHFIHHFCVFYLFFGPQQSVFRFGYFHT